ncbi:ATP-dependent DNA helicase [Trichonephila clavipes]|nr:ATP-dependent DNA helicase [Trichonephila clavipes]
MRVHLHNDVDSGLNSEMLWKIGDGCLEVDDEGCISLSREFYNLVENDMDLITHVFPELQQNLSCDQWLCARGVPSHKLQLKLTVPVMLMRNLNAALLWNGTRLRRTKLGQNILGASILTGVGKGKRVILPRIPIIPTELPFQFKRVQFPVKLSFAVTINKAQGQTLQAAAVHLEKRCFSHT